MTVFQPLEQNYLPLNFRDHVELYDSESMNYAPINYLFQSEVVKCWTNEPGEVNLNEYKCVGIFCFYKSDKPFKEKKEWNWAEKYTADFEDDYIKDLTKYLRSETKEQCDSLGIKYLTNKQQYESLEKASKRWAELIPEQEESKSTLISTKTTPEIIEINFLNDLNKNVYNYKCNQKGEIIMKTVNGKNKTERMVNKPLKYMGLTCEEHNSNKHMYATIENGDFDKYAYFVVYEQPHSFSQTLPNGKTITKFVFHIDNYDDGKGHDGIFVPTWMCLNLVGADVNDPQGYLIAFERNQWNMKVINALQKLNDGADSIMYVTPEILKEKEFKYHY